MMKRGLEPVLWCDPFHEELEVKARLPSSVGYELH